MRRSRRRCLQAELLARILSKLAPAHLARAEAACRSFRAAAVQHGLWRQACLAAHGPVGALAARVGLRELPAALHKEGWLPAAEVQRSAFFKRCVPGCCACAGWAAANAGFLPHLHFPVGEQQPFSGPLQQHVWGTPRSRHVPACCRLLYRLTAPQARESLVATAILASSTDHPQVCRWPRAWSALCDASSVGTKFCCCVSSFSAIRMYYSLFV